MEKILLTLQKSNLFKNNSLDEISHLLSNIIYKIDSYKKNEIIFSSNKTADTIGILLSGVVVIQKLFPSGKVVIIAKKNKHDLIAEASTFSESKYYPATALVYKPCKILLINKIQLLKLFSMNQAITLNFLESVSNSMEKLKFKIAILSLNSIREKIACFLLHKCRHTNSNIITLPFSKKNFAEYLNVSRTSLSKELRKLEVDKIISFDRRNIEIKNLEALKKIVFQGF